MSRKEETHKTFELDANGMNLSRDMAMRAIWESLRAFSDRESKTMLWRAHPQTYTAAMNYVSQDAIQVKFATPADLEQFRLPDITLCGRMFYKDNNVPARELWLRNEDGLLLARIYNLGEPCHQQTN